MEREGGERKTCEQKQMERLDSSVPAYHSPQSGVWRERERERGFN